jgi:hypothetical protein
MVGRAAANKGLPLFPHRIRGRFAAMHGQQRQWPLSPHLGAVAATRGTTSNINIRTEQPRNSAALEYVHSTRSAGHSHRRTRVRRRFGHTNTCAKTTSAAVTKCWMPGCLNLGAAATGSTKVQTRHRQQRRSSGLQRPCCRLEEPERCYHTTGCPPGIRESAWASNTLRDISTAADEPPGR